MKGKKQTAKSGRIYFSIVILTALILTVGGVFVVQANSSPADTAVRIKYYKSIEVQPGDSLWSIAKKYRTQEYPSIYAYIQDIYTMNGLTSERIQAGTYLMITCYRDADMAPGVEEDTESFVKQAAGSDL